MNAMGLLRVAGVLCALLLVGCKWEQVEKTVGYRGPARQDPFLAAKRMLGEMGTLVESSSSFTQIPHDSSVLVTALQSFISYGDAELALGWVERGGHLVVFLSDAEQWRNDHAEFSILEIIKEREPGDEELRFLKMVGATGVERGQKVEGLTVGSRKYAAELKDGVTFETKPVLRDVSAGEDGAPALVSFPRQGGQVTLIASAQPFRNRHIGDKDHAALLLALMHAGGQADAVTFLNNVRVSFWSMLWAHGWMAIVALAALLAFWLLKNMPRFGPAYVREDRKAREFAEHLQLTGAFLWRCREANALIEPMRRHVRETAARLGIHADQLHARLAEMSALPEGRVVAAITGAVPTDAHHFLRITQDLHTIRQSL